MTMTIFFLILGNVFFAALALYYWARSEWYRAEWKATFEPLDPPNITNRNPDIERFWDYARDREEIENGF